MANARGRERERKRDEDRGGKRRVRGSCFRPGEQQCPQTNEHPASIVRLIGTAQPHPGSACATPDLPMSSSGPCRPPTPGWGVLDQPDAGQHRLNIAASSNPRQRESPRSSPSFLFLPPSLFLHPRSLYLSIYPIPSASFVLSLDHSLTCFCLYVHSLVSCVILLLSARLLCSRWCGSIAGKVQKPGHVMTLVRHIRHQDYVDWLRKYCKL